MDTKGCLILVVGFFALYSIALAIAGITILIDGYFYGSDLQFFYPLFALIVILIVGFIYNKISTQREKLENALHKMHNYPKRIVSKDGGKWGRSFQKVIDGVIENVTEEAKRKDLEQCGKIVKTMTNEKSFDNLHRAFLLSGCHMKITDGNGKIITKIV